MGSRPDGLSSRAQRGICFSNWFYKKQIPRCARDKRKGANCTIAKRPLFHALWYSPSIMRSILVFITFLSAYLLCGAQGKPAPQPSQPQPTRSTQDVEAADAAKINQIAAATINW